jgi:hypothetical protein
MKIVYGNLTMLPISLQSAAVLVSILTYLLTYLLVFPAWSRALLEKLTFFQLVKKFPAFYGTRRCIIEL